ncbi:MAG TPA: hypothetical protein VG963_32055 [Polyangiaceae bacterium]|nr:hypothetical protein [Polyangiaceae bacterium]
MGDTAGRGAGETAARGAGETGARGGGEPGARGEAAGRPPAELGERGAAGRPSAELGERGAGGRRSAELGERGAGDVARVLIVEDPADERAGDPGALESRGGIWDELRGRVAEGFGAGRARRTAPSSSSRRKCTFTRSAGIPVAPAITSALLCPSTRESTNASSGPSGNDRISTPGTRW